jgi:hypothetical protein
MSEWHLRYNRNLLKKARKIVGETFLTDASVEIPTFDVLNKIDKVIATIDRKLDNKARRSGDSEHSTASNQVEPPDGLRLG